jgi:PPK2 family polyphosphate:nucleotide phosphotransferase
MKTEELLIRPGRVVKLADFDSRFTGKFEKRSDADDKLKRDIERLAKLQDVFAAVQSHALLIVMQGMDSAGKDGAIKHVMSGVNPQGVDVHGFKAPTPEEVRHDFLWRCERELPERGRIVIFNRSYFEEVLVVRVHREMLALEAAAKDKTVWADRYEDINAFERHLTRNGTIVLKFFFHISKTEQRKRLLERLDDPDKNWKFSPNDIKERAYWDHYQSAYEKMLTATSTPWAPWHIIPADHKWFARAAVADAIVTKLEELDLHYPHLDSKATEMLAQIRTQLASE